MIVWLLTIIIQLLVHHDCLVINHYYTATSTYGPCIGSIYLWVCFGYADAMSGPSVRLLRCAGYGWAYAVMSYEILWFLQTF